MLVELGVGAGMLVASALGRYRRRKRAGDDLPLAPAYPRLVQHPPAVRRALDDVAKGLSLDPAALATVIELESGWDPSVPHKRIGTPRAGLNQLTVGAKLPGFDTAEKVWAVRGWSAERQLRKVVLPYFKRFAERSIAWTALDLYKRNFLPADVHRARDFHIGERGSTELVTPGGHLTRGQVYDANSGFDPGGHKGYFTWDDVARVLAGVESHAHGKWVTAAGKLVDPPAKANQKESPPARGPAPGPVGSAVAPAILVLLRQLNERWPLRSRASDGMLGDAAHQARKSDHNTGDAIDITLDPARGPSLDALASALLADPRTHYVIWNRRIANRTIQGGAWRPYDQGKGGNPHTRHLHLSIVRDRRAEAQPWQLPAAAEAVAGAVAAPPPPPLPQAYEAGLIDNVVPAELEVGPYRLRVAADALAIGGIRRPASFADVLVFCKLSGMIPATRAIVDARWNQAARQVVLDPAQPNGEPVEPNIAEQAAEWSRRIGPISTELVAGPWWEWVLDGVEQKGEARLYGLRGEGGALVEPADVRPRADYVSHATLFAPVYRRAVLDAGEVDLLDELERGCELGGPLPAWIVEVLR